MSKTLTERLVDEGAPELPEHLRYGVEVTIEPDGWATITAWIIPEEHKNDPSKALYEGFAKVGLHDIDDQVSLHSIMLAIERAYHQYDARSAIEPRAVAILDGSH